jgi:two-component system, OmpR family, sensor histidine kinase ArlS
MKIPAFIRTIRFRLTLWYVAFLIFVVIALVIGLNVGVVQHYTARPQPAGVSPAPNPVLTEPNENDIRNSLFKYSIIGVVAAAVVGATGIYFLSGTILKPIDKVTLLARRSSYSNLKERLNYKGPNDEVKRLADTLDDMLTRLKGAADSQKQFIQDAAHELRTPIATALTNIEVLEMKSKSTMEDYQELTRVLKLSLDRMNNISNSLQLLSEDPNSLARLEKVNIQAIITTVVNEAEMEARRQGIVINWIQPAAETLILGDAFRLQQLIFNMVDNAIKYNCPGGSVNVEFHTENQSVIIQIADTGIGIASEDLPRVFDRFFRVDKSRSRQRGGSGLGLAIVKKVVEDHQGTVSLESVPGQGSTFSVKLPLYPQE